MKKCVILLLAVIPVTLFAQVNPAQENVVLNKYALVIGNGSYSNLSRLANPVNDANDMTAALRELGFNVETILNGGLEQMESAVLRLRDRLSESQDSYGFLFYAGHGVQSGGENYLIPVDAAIPSESYLRNRALSVQVVLDDLNEARNSLNVLVLDACRDNPFGWGRSAGRGLAVIGRQPANSIIVYATSAGQQAADGEGRNGMFTSQLLHNLRDPGLDVNEVFRRTGADVSAASNARQISAIYSQFFGIAFLSGAPGNAISARPQPIQPRQPAQPIPQPAQPIKEKRGDDDTRLHTVGASVGTSFSAPWFIGTIHGTISPFKHSFIELGADIGMISGIRDVGYNSVQPFGHLAFFMPIGSQFGWYAGAGGGYVISGYDYPEGKVKRNYAVASVSVGLNLWDMIDVSYTLRTNFSGISNKVSAGYVYRFK